MISSADSELDFFITRVRSCSDSKNIKGTGSYKSASIAATNDYFGDKFGMVRQPIRPAAAVAAIEKGALKKYFLLFFIAAFSIAAID